MGVGVKSSVLLHAEQVAEVQFAVEERGRPEDTPVARVGFVNVGMARHGQSR